MKNKRVYVDTSVFGGVFDPEFDKASQEFFDQVRDGRFILVTSVLVRDELEPAPNQVRDHFENLKPFMEEVDITPDALRLQEAYLKAEVVSRKWEDDALHVAVATAAGCGMIISWNFKHIVHYDKIPLYDAVNVLQGFDKINIFSPSEVIAYDENI